jgi:hypothetical protein
MGILLLIFALMATVLVIASGVWVAIALIGAIAHIEPGPASAEDQAPGQDRA